jgi:hypothetical protein
MTETDDTPDLVTEAFDEYVAGFRAGRGDPRSILSRFQGEDRQQLELLIEAFIATGPVSDPDPGDPRVAGILEQVVEGLETPRTGLAAFVAAARQKAKMTQDAVVKAIAESIDASPPETEKIDFYYHQMEWGSLPADRVSDDLFGTLGKLFGLAPADFRKAASVPGSEQSYSGQIFARSVEEIELNQDASVAFDPAPTIVPSLEDKDHAEPDRIDKLFTGG